MFYLDIFLCQILLACHIQQSQTDMYWLTNIIGRYWRITDILVSAKPICYVVLLCLIYGNSFFREMMMQEKVLGVKNKQTTTTLTPM